MTNDDGILDLTYIVLPRFSSGNFMDRMNALDNALTAAISDLSWDSLPEACRQSNGWDSLTDTPMSKVEGLLLAAAQTVIRSNLWRETDLVDLLVAPADHADILAYARLVESGVWAAAMEKLTPFRCSVCRSKSITVKAAESDSDVTLLKACKCKSCGHTWNVVYNVTSAV